MRKKVNKYGNRTYTVKELQELLPKLECNRKRNYWTVFKDKRLIYMHEVQKLSFREIQKQFPERTKSALEQRYEKLKRGAA